VHDVAKEEHLSAAYLDTLLRLPWLAPDITTAIINGRKPPQLTAQQLMRLTPRLPLSGSRGAFAVQPNPRPSLKSIGI
jgi:site-specific DNA recombinase